jgi:hypothetical protein
MESVLPESAAVAYGWPDFQFEPRAAKLVPDANPPDQSSVCARLTELERGSADMRRMFGEIDTRINLLLSLLEQKLENGLTICDVLNTA